MHGSVMFVVSQTISRTHFKIICDGVMTKEFVCCCSKFLTFLFTYFYALF